MRIVVLGGAGDMGAEAVRDLVSYSKAHQIVIADRNVREAKRLAASLNDERVMVEEVDATSHEALVKLMRGSSKMSGGTVVAGALGPFYRFERPIIEAAIEAGANYVSICDDHDAVEAALELNDLARQKGRRIIPGMGWTPGLSNMLARRGYDLLNNVEKINIYWGAGVSDSKGLAVILHTIHIFTGRVTSYSGGKMVLVKAGSGKEAISFPDPLGEIKAFHLGHPEPVTLPRYLEGINEITLKGGLAENYLNYLAKMLSGLGLTRNSFTKQMLGHVMKGLMPILPKNKKKSVSGIRVDVSGKLSGNPTRLSYAVVDNMRRLTGIPLSIGAIMLAENKVPAFGVFGPEADNAIDSTLFFKELNRRGIIIGEREVQ